MKKILALTVFIVLVFCISGIDNTLADEAKNEAIIERNMEEIWNNQNYAVADEIVAPNYVRHLPGGKEVKGREGYKEFVKSFMKSSPDTRGIMERVASEGDYVVVYYLVSGTHTGSGGSLGPPTGKKWNWEAIVIHRLAGGEMRECWQIGDDLGFMTQLGYKLVPPE